MIVIPIAIYRSETVFKIIKSTFKKAIYFILIIWFTDVIHKDCFRSLSCDLHLLFKAAISKSFLAKDHLEKI